MSDPCQNLDACGAENTLNLAGGTFRYPCLKIPPGTNTDLTLTPISGQERKYRVVIGGLNVLNFSLTGFLGNTFSISGSVAIGYEAYVEPPPTIFNNDTLVITDTHRGITWRIGTSTFFTSCLIYGCISTDTVRLNAGSGAFDFPCGSPLPSISRRLILNKDGLDVYTVFLQSSGVFTAAGTFEVSGDRFINPKPNPDFLLQLQNRELVVGSNNLRWALKLDVDEDLQRIFRAAFFPPFRTNLGAPTPQPPGMVPADCNTIFGEVVATPDGKEICSSHFLVSTCDECQKTEQGYTFYCTKVSSMVWGPSGCNLSAKAIRLSQKGYDVTATGLATYGMLRLMLSLLLFGTLDINFLRQGYYSKFIKKLSTSLFSAYAVIFEDSPYWQYFKK